MITTKKKKKRKKEIGVRKIKRKEQKEKKKNGKKKTGKRNIRKNKEKNKSERKAKEKNLHFARNQFRDVALLSRIAGLGIAGGKGITPSLQHIAMRYTVSVFPSFSRFSGVTTINTSMEQK